MNRYNQLSKELETLFDMDIVDMESLSDEKLKSLCCIYLIINDETLVNQPLDTQGRFIITGTIQMYNGSTVCKSQPGYINDCILNKNFSEQLEFHQPLKTLQKNIEGISVRTESIDFTYYVEEQYNKDKLKEII